MKSVPDRRPQPPLSELESFLGLHRLPCAPTRRALLQRAMRAPRCVAGGSGHPVALSNVEQCWYKMQMQGGKMLSSTPRSTPSVHLPTRPLNQNFLQKCPTPTNTHITRTSTRLGELINSIERAGGRFSLDMNAGSSTPTASKGTLSPTTLEVNSPCNMISAASAPIPTVQGIPTARGAPTTRGTPTTQGTPTFHLWSSPLLVG